MALHEVPAGERVEHFLTAACPCSPARTVGERPDHAPGTLLTHQALRPGNDEEGPVSRPPS